MDWPPKPRSDARIIDSMLFLDQDGGGFRGPRHKLSCVTEKKKDEGLLVPLLILDRPWQSGYMDLNNGFPKIEGFCCIMVVISWFQSILFSYLLPMHALQMTQCTCFSSMLSNIGGCRRI